MKTPPFPSTSFPTRHFRAAASPGPEHAPAAPETPPGRHALVLGGGGSTGHAWLIGLIAGLSDAGTDVTDAGLTIGTSAGATAAAQLAGASAADLFAAILSEPRRPAPGPAGPGAAGPGAAGKGTAGKGTAGPGAAGKGTAGQSAAGAPAHPVSGHLERIGTIIAASRDAAEMRRRMGAAALEMEAASDLSWQDRWHATVADRLPGGDWPGRALFLTAVDARSGEAGVFDRHSGVDLTDAVAASGSSGMPYGIGAARYIDGGYRRNENADLAAGYGQVLVFSPFGGRSLHPRHWRTDLAAQAAELRAAGSRVETVVPDSGTEQLFGANAMDPSLRRPAAEAGYRQGRGLAGRLSGFGADGRLDGLS